VQAQQHPQAPAQGHGLSSQGMLDKPEGAWAPKPVLFPKPKPRQAAAWAASLAGLGEINRCAQANGEPFSGL